MVQAIYGYQHTIYRLSDSNKLGDLITTKAKPKDHHGTHVLQDLAFPIASNKIVCSKDEQYVACVGVYPPELKIYDVTQSSLKCARRFDAEVVDFQFLSNDYKKLVFLQNDRFLEFHAQGGLYHKLRVPQFGHALDYLPSTAELLVVGSSESIHRLDLENGVFEEPIQSNNLDVINAVKHHPHHSIVLIAGSDGYIEAFDTRSWEAVRRIRVPNVDGETDEVTSMNLAQDGLTFAVGTQHGLCYLYDIRCQTPFHTRDHYNEFPIKDIQLFRMRSSEESPSRTIVGSLDRKILKFWDDTSSVIATIHPEAPARNQSTGDLNNFCVFPRSGLIFVAQDNTHVGAYYLPILGLAPKWCSFLDNIIEQHDEALNQKTGPERSDDDMQFVTLTQLQQLQADHLVGTNLIQPYMHGFLMPIRLFKKYRAVFDAMAYDEYRKEKLQQKLDRKKSMRVLIKNKLTEPVVNKNIAQTLSAKAQNPDSKVSRAAQSILTDERFNQIFMNPEFAVESLVMQPDSLQKKKRK